MFLQINACKKADKLEKHTNILSKNGIHDSIPGDGTWINHSQLNLSEINTNGVTTHFIGEGFNFTDTILEFSSDSSFTNTIKSIFYQSDSIIDLWENNLGFLSMRRHNDLIHPTFDSTRIPDRFFESLLSKKGNIRISDTIYSIKHMVDSVYVYTLNGTLARSVNTRSDCGLVVGKKYWCGDRYVSDPPVLGDILIVNKKWSDNWLIYSSIGNTTEGYRYTMINPPGGSISYNFIKSKFPRISFSLDPWNTIRYKPNAVFATWKTITGWDNHYDTNSKSVEKIYAFRTLLFSFTGYCVSDFGRIHFFLDNYEEDTHHEGFTDMVCIFN